jgi:hypothetical protein
VQKLFEDPLYVPCFLFSFTCLLSSCYFACMYVLVIPQSKLSTFFNIFCSSFVILLLSIWQIYSSIVWTYFINFLVSLFNIFHLSLFSSVLPLNHIHHVRFEVFLNGGYEEFYILGCNAMYSYNLLKVSQQFGRSHILFQG